MYRSTERCGVLGRWGETGQREAGREPLGDLLFTTALLWREGVQKEGATGLFWAAAVGHCHPEVGRLQHQNRAREPCLMGIWKSYYGVSYGVNENGTYAES